jgi:hypothetical protein
MAAARPPRVRVATEAGDLGVVAGAGHDTKIEINGGLKIMVMAAMF